MGFRTYHHTTVPCIHKVGLSLGPSQNATRLRIGQSLSSCSFDWLVPELDAYPSLALFWLQSVPCREASLWQTAFGCIVLTNQMLPELQGRVLLEPGWSLANAKTIYFGIVSPFSFAWCLLWNGHWIGSERSRCGLVDKSSL